MKNISSTTTPIKKYVLHFDLFKTITLADPLEKEKVDKEAILLEYLVNFAWGRRDEKNPKLWKIYHPHFSLTNPEPENFQSYAEYVQEEFPLRTQEEEPDNELREKYNEDMKKIWKTNYVSFVKPGYPGLKLKPEYDRINKNITIPKGIADELKISKESETRKENESQNEDNNDLGELFSDGKQFLFHSFFRLMISLKKAKKEFGIVFRSPKEDLENAILEFNKFCTGDHPCFSGRNNTPLARFDGSKGTKNYLITENQQSVIYNNNTPFEEIKYVIRSLRKVNRNGNFEELYAKEIEEGSTQVLTDYQEFFSYFMEMLMEVILG